jgi:hypothetical protein
MHEGASGGGKSEMLEHIHRQDDGRLLLGEDTTVTGEQAPAHPPADLQISAPSPTTWPSATPEMQANGAGESGPKKLTLADAENAWFVRVNHIDQVRRRPPPRAVCAPSPNTRCSSSTSTPSPARPRLIWEHIEDEPGTPCPNPRVVIPRDIVPHHPSGNPWTVDIRSFGVRCPPAPEGEPDLRDPGTVPCPPPCPRLALATGRAARARQSLASSIPAGMSSEGVGSYWPFATGRRVDQANILKQILETKKVKYILVPNQHVGAWKVSFMPQWLTREFMARRGGAIFDSSKVHACRCPLLGWAPSSIMVEGRPIGSWFFDVTKQPEVGEEAYDRGAEILQEFFRSELNHFLEDDLMPLGKEIIECCLNQGTVDDYQALIPHPTLIEEELDLASA